MPTWLSAFFGEEKIELHGERLDFDNIERLVRRDIQRKEYEESRHAYDYDDEELDEDTMEAYYMNRI